MEELTAIFIAVLLQIAGMLKDNEKIQSNPTTAPSDDDSEIKKIKKVRLVFKTRNHSVSKSSELPIPTITECINSRIYTMAALLAYLLKQASH